MSKNVLRIIIYIFSILSITGCSTFTTSSNIKTAQITELNQTYNGPLLKITATDIKSISSPYNEEEIIIGVRFIIENSSTNNFLLSPINFSAYVDNITAQGSINSELNVAGEKLNGEIASGKSAKGFYAVEAPKDAKQIEVRIEEAFEKSYAVFVFDVPAIIVN